MNRDGFFYFIRRGRNVTLSFLNVTLSPSKGFARSNIKLIAFAPPLWGSSHAKRCGIGEVLIPLFGKGSTKAEEHMLNDSRGVKYLSRQIRGL